MHDYYSIDRCHFIRKGMDKRMDAFKISDFYAAFEGRDFTEYTGAIWSNFYTMRKRIELSYRRLNKMTLNSKELDKIKILESLYKNDLMYFENLFLNSKKEEVSIFRKYFAINKERYLRETKCKMGRLTIFEDRVKIHIRESEDSTNSYELKTSVLDIDSSGSILINDGKEERWISVSDFERCHKN
jgi:hypothetical protein